MAFPGDDDKAPHVRLGDSLYRVDEGVFEFGLVPYRHYRAPAPIEGSITGQESRAPIEREQLWVMTNFAGEGQKVLDGGDPRSADLFYRSEGLDFRTPGQFQLNQSVMLQKPQQAGSSTTTIQGSAFNDITGTSTTVNTTDQRLNAINDEIETSDQTPGAGTHQVEFYAYHEGEQLTDIEGGNFVSVRDGAASGTDWRLKNEGDRARTANLSVTATQVTKVDVYAFCSTAPGARRPRLRAAVRDITNSKNPTTVAVDTKVFSDTTTALQLTLLFTPRANRTYRVFFTYDVKPQQFGGHILVDKISYGAVIDPNNSITIEVFDETNTVSLTSATVNVTSESSALVGSLTYTGVAATDYSYRVLYAAGAQRPIVDRVVDNEQTAGSTIYNIDHLELGQGGSIWAVGVSSAADPEAWTYNFSTDAWTDRVSVSGVGSASTCKALAHTDKFQYGLFSDKKVYQWTTSADNDYTGALTGTAVGMCITQDRLFTLDGDASNVLTVTTFDVDQDVSATPESSVDSATVTNALVAYDSSLRQVMVGTPTGARFFVNYSDGTSKIYEADASGASLVVRGIGDLEPGAKATAIAYSSGVTFIVGQFVADSGSTPRSGLWVIDQNGTLRRIGYIRRDDPPSQQPIGLQAYQNDLYIFQGAHIWRYSLVSGGLFHEYEMPTSNAGAARALAVLQGHTFAAFNDPNDGIYVTGTEGTFRQSSQAGSNFISSTYDFLFPQQDKSLRQVEVVTESLPANTSVSVDVQADEDGTWIPLGTRTTGANLIFQGAEEGTPIDFRVLSVRVTLATSSGTTTPVVLSIVARALVTETEEFYELYLRATDEDSSDHLPDQQATGAEKARYALELSGTTTELEDGYVSRLPNDNTVAKVYVEDADFRAFKRGEGSMFVRARVIQ